MQREKNMNSELENAFNKELNIIKNDFYYQQLELPLENPSRIIRLDISYTPMEILSGDSYSIRKSYDDKIVFFLVDAMGKGVSASLTATTTTSLLNYIFEQMQKKRNFKLSRLIQKYIEFIQHELLDNEMLSIVFGMFSKKTAKISYASFGMPAILIKPQRGELVKLKSNNMPINKYVKDFKIEKFDVKNVEKILIYTDGLCENKLSNGEFYKNYMYQDFIDSECVSDFIEKIQTRFEKAQDDRAFFYINTLNIRKNWQYHKIKGTRKEINFILSEIKKFLQKYNVKPKESSEIILAMSELLLNAVEHGIYGIDKTLKSKLIEEGTFDECLDVLEEKNEDKLINIFFDVKCTKKGKLFCAKVIDPGEGFDVCSLRQLDINPKSFNGRGIMIIKKLLDRFYYNEKGNSITVRKLISSL
jgi:two-component system, HptB-dependent secretion and biofilm response regulator